MHPDLGLQKPLFAGIEIILVGNLMIVIQPQPSHLMFVPLTWKQIVDFNCGTNDFFCFDAQGSYKQAPGKCNCASTGLMTSLTQKKVFTSHIYLPSNVSFVLFCVLNTNWGLQTTEVFLSCINEICCGVYILKQRTPSILKNGTVFSMSRNELPKDETLLSTTEIHAFTFNSLHQQFLISLLLFLVLNFPLDFVVPLDVKVILLNPLFGVNASLSDQFISRALIFRPRLVVLNYHLTTNKDICLTNPSTLTWLQSFRSSQLKHRVAATLLHMSSIMMYLWLGLSGWSTGGTPWFGRMTDCPEIA